MINISKWLLLLPVNHSTPPSSSPNIFSLPLFKYKATQTVCYPFFCMSLSLFLSLILGFNLTIHRWIVSVRAHQLTYVSLWFFTIQLQHFSKSGIHLTGCLAGETLGLRKCTINRWTLAMLTLSKHFSFYIQMHRSNPSWVFLYTVLYSILSSMGDEWSYLWKQGYHIIEDQAALSFLTNIHYRKKSGNKVQLLNHWWMYTLRSSSSVYALENANTCKLEIV